MLPAGFWLAIVAGLALRVWYFSDLAAQPWFGYPLVDALTFDRTALGILRDGMPGAFFRPPLYPLFLAAVYRLFGHSAAAVVWIQFALGLAALVPAYRLGERLFGGRAALAGAWIGACYPLRIFLRRRRSTSRSSRCSFSSRPGASGRGSKPIRSRRSFSRACSTAPQRSPGQTS
jgi:hypothetical protein